MKRRRLLAEAVALVSLTGCVTESPESQPTETPTLTPPRTTKPTATPTATSTPDASKPGRVDNHRITAVEALSHEAVRRSTEDGVEWVVRVTLRLKPQDEASVTVYPIGIFFIFFDADGTKLYREYRQVSANTCETARTETVSTVFRPDEAGADTFARYRIDLVHA